MTVLFVGDDWAADHHDVELMDQAGRTLARARLSEGAAGMAKLHALIGEHADVADGEDDLEVRIGIETDHGPWVTALAAAGYVVFAVNPLQAARYRERHVVSGAKSDTGDGHILADMVRTDAHQLRPVADDTHEAGDCLVGARVGSGDLEMMPVRDPPGEILSGSLIDALRHLPLRTGV